MDIGIERTTEVLDQPNRAGLAHLTSKTDLPYQVRRERH